MWFVRSSEVPKKYQFIENSSVSNRCYSAYARVEQPAVLISSRDLTRGVTRFKCEPAFRKLL